MTTLINNIIKSYKHIPYTFKHYIAFLKMEKKLLGYYKYKFHDLVNSNIVIDDLLTKYDVIRKLKKKFR